MTVGDFSEQANWYGTARPTYPPALIKERFCADDAGRMDDLGVMPP